MLSIKKRKAMPQISAKSSENEVLRATSPKEMEVATAKSGPKGLGISAISQLKAAKKSPTAMSGENGVITSKDMEALEHPSAKEDKETVSEAREAYKARLKKRVK